MVMTGGAIREPVGGRWRNILKLKCIFLFLLSMKIWYQEFTEIIFQQNWVRGVLYVQYVCLLLHLQSASQHCFYLWSLKLVLRVRINGLRVEMQLLWAIIWLHMNAWLRHWNAAKFQRKENKRSIKKIKYTFHFVPCWVSHNQFQSKCSTGIFEISSAIIFGFLPVHILSQHVEITSYFYAVYSISFKD